MEIPPQILKKIITPGTVFLFTQETFKDPKPHFFVVLNFDPKTEELYLMVHATSKVEKRKFEASLMGLPEETLVVIKANEYVFWKKESAFDCNYPTVRTTDDLIEKYRQKSLKVIGEITPDLLALLRDGVLKSPMVDEDTKGIIQK